MNLHDWIDELCDVLDVEAEVDEALVLDLARDAAHNVERRAAPITTYLLGYAAGLQDANPAAIEALAAKATTLARRVGPPGRRTRPRRHHRRGPRRQRRSTTAPTASRTDVRAVVAAEAGGPDVLSVDEVDDVVAGSG